jgi:urease accessory protein
VTLAQCFERETIGVPVNPIPKRLAALLAVFSPLALAHHVMDYALPATALEGLLSGLGHPVIGVDHLIFIVAAGVLAARFERGWALPLAFVVASSSVAALRHAGADAVLGELPVAASLIVLGAVLLAAWRPGAAVVAMLFLAGGAIHGHALGEAIVGAEQTPLLAYLAGLTIIQCAIALSSGAVASWTASRHPQFPLQKWAGAVVGAAGLVFAGMAI